MSQLAAEPSKTTSDGSPPATSSQSKIALRGEHFYKFFQCPHWIWYDIYGDPEHRKETAPLLELIYRGKIANPGEVLKNFKQFEEIKPELFKDLDEAFLSTLELMKQGKNIFHGVLMHADWVGIPDLLIARPGKSKFGKWEYAVYDTQSSLDLRDEYKFPLVFYSLILEELQGIRPTEAYVIDPQGNERSFLVNDFVDQFHMNREQIQKILNGEKPAPFLKSGCKRTPWYSLCLSDTEGCNDVSLVHRLSQGDQKRLYDIGIRTVSDLAKANLEDMQAQLEDWPFDKLIRVTNQAKVLISGEPLILKRPQFPEVKKEVYFDVESDPTRDLDYLLGVLVKNTKTGHVEYKYFLSKNKSEEEAMWKSFLDFLVTLDDFVIYHFAFYEHQVFERLTLRYGAPSELVSKFNEHTIDLQMEVVDSLVLPIYFYTLKDVGKYYGYQWRNPNAGGAESVVWYDEWLRTNDNAVLQRILTYNEDDVRATLLVKEKLEEQKPARVKEVLD
ncbi:MAG: TM0106 family RecB-like putative nuclease [Candidatus Yanofskybacteria bacterium]|nr:TM0106 family RecB-like putative nuclease [Candidatus Yanofskybacteria bacterium]